VPGPTGPTGPTGPAGEYTAGDGIDITDDVISVTPETLARLVPDPNDVPAGDILSIGSLGMEWTEPGILGDTYIFNENFDSLVSGAAGVPDPEYWSGGGTIVDGPRGGLRLPLDAATTITRGLYLWTQAQMPKARFRVLLTGDPGGDTHAFLHFRDSGGTNHFGVCFELTAVKIRGFVVTGGVPVLTNVDNWVSMTEYAIKVEVREDYHLWIQVNWAAAVDCGLIPDATYTFRICTGSGGGSGKEMIIRKLQIRANWSLLE
jgi:hypothetical protein